MKALSLRLPRPSFGMSVSLVALGLLALLLPVGGSGTFDRAEVYFMDAARHMVEKGEWLVPFYRDQPFFDKPILTYWLMAGAFELFGCTPEAARLVPAAAALGTLIVTVWLGVLLHSRRAGLMAGAILATTLPFTTFGRVAMSDMPMTFLATLAVALGVKAYQTPHGRWMIPLAAAALGLGFATKGPIAVLLPTLALGALVWDKRGSRPPLAPLPVILGLVAFAVLGLGWFLALYLRLGLQPLRYFFLQENLARFAGSTYDSERGPAYYVLTYLTLGAPWSLLLPPAILRVLKAADRENGRDARWIALALLLMVLPLSVSRGKIDYYLLPLYPPAAVLIGTFLAAPWTRAASILSRIVAGLAAALSLLTLLPPRLPAAWLPGMRDRVFVAALVLVALVALLWTVWRPSPVRLVATLSGSLALFFATFAYVWAPAFASGQPNRVIVRDVRRELAYRPEARFVLCEDPARVHRDVIFWSTIRTYDICEPWATMSSREALLEILDQQEWTSLRAHPRVRLVRAYHYIPSDAFGLRSMLLRQPPQRLFLAANYQTTDPIARKIRRSRWRRAHEEQQEWLRREEERRSPASEHPSPSAGLSGH